MPKPPHFDQRELAAELDDLMCRHAQRLHIFTIQAAPAALHNALEIVVSAANAAIEDKLRVINAVALLREALSDALIGAVDERTLAGHDIGRAMLIAKARSFPEHELSRAEASAILGKEYRHILRLIEQGKMESLAGGHVLAYYETLARRPYRARATG